MRILVFGNSGSGKTTLARRLAERHGLARLDLDSIVWEPGGAAVQRPAQAIAASLDAFVSAHERWVVEGCYGELVEAASRQCTLLVFLDPGIDACLRRNRERPWEPHKHASPAEQDAMLGTLQAWVAGYRERDDPWSWQAHRRIFDAFAGRKIEHTGVEPLETRPPCGAIDVPATSETPETSETQGARAVSTPVLSPAIPQLPSGDLRRTADFYRDRLGFTELSHFPEHGHLIARRGLVEIHFWLAASEEEARRLGSASSCYIRVRGVVALHEEFERRQAPFRYGLTRQPWGMHEMQVDDPYGNAIRFGEAIDA